MGGNICALREPSARCFKVRNKSINICSFLGALTAAAAALYAGADNETVLTS